jgi:chromosome segregation protein
MYENLVAFLLDDVYITDKTIPFTASASTETPVLFGELSWDWSEHTVVSITGAMTKRKFSLTGGSTSLLEGNKIGKAVQLKKLENEISELNLLIHNKKLEQEQDQLEEAKEFKYTPINESNVIYLDNFAYIERVDHRMRLVTHDFEMYY